VTFRGDDTTVRRIGTLTVAHVSTIDARPTRSRRWCGAGSRRLFGGRGRDIVVLAGLHGVDRAIVVAGNDDLEYDDDELDDHDGAADHDNDDDNDIGSPPARPGHRGRGFA